MCALQDANAQSLTQYSRVARYESIVTDTVLVREQCARVARYECTVIDTVLVREQYTHVLEGRNALSPTSSS